MKFKLKNKRFKNEVYLVEFIHSNQTINFLQLIDKLDEKGILGFEVFKSEFKLDLPKYQKLKDDYEIKNNKKVVVLYISYSDRTTISIQLDKKQIITLRVPHKTPKTTIDKVLNEKYSWIYSKYELMQTKAEKVEDRVFGEGGMFMFLGGKYNLVHNINCRFGIYFDKTKFETPYENQDEIKAALEKWYKKNAKKILTERTNYFANLYSLPYRSIKINSAKTRWGSCSSKNDINYSWKLIQAPIEVVDYVIIHELVHTKIKNHSQHFWDAVAKIYPDYRNAVKYLKDNNFIIEFD